MPRGLEAFIAFLALLGSLPLIIISAVLIRITSRGPVLFRQSRVGRNGRPFTLIKLRTMEQQENGLQVTARTDPRITGVGRVLRRTKVDELPEFWNVLKGDMSLVGPRPEVPRYVDPGNRNWQIILQARPGLTDPVTLRLRNEELLLAEFEGDVEKFYRDVLQPAKLRGYIDYLETRSCREDLRIIFQTAITMIRPDAIPAPDVSGIYVEAIGRETH